MGEFKRSRDPNNFSDDDYGNFLTGIEKYHDDHGADPDFYPHWAILAPLITEFKAKLQDFVAAKQRIISTKEVYDAVVVDTRENMLQLRRQLPVVIRGENVLGKFGLEDEVPEDVDLLLVNARICRDHWADLCDPAPPAEYLPLQSKLDAMAGFVTSIEDSQRDYADAIRVKEDARLAKDLARDAVHKEERGMFNWYRGIWTDPEDTHWSSTPWPRSSGGGGTGWPKKPVGKMSIAPDPLDGILAGCEEYDGTKRFDLRIVGVKKNDPVPEMPLVDTYTDIEQPALLDSDGFPLQKNFVYYLWIRARKDGEVSDWSEVVGMLWE